MASNLCCGVTITVTVTYLLFSVHVSVPICDLEAVHMLTGGDGGYPGEGFLPLGGASPASDYSYIWLHSSASLGGLDLTFCINWVVPRVMPLVLHGLLTA